MRALVVLTLLTAILSSFGASALTPVRPRAAVSAPVDFDRALDLVTGQARREYFVPLGVDAPASRIPEVQAGRVVLLQRVAAEPMPGEARFAHLDVQILDLRSPAAAAAYAEQIQRTALTGAFADGSRVFVFTTDAPEFHRHVSGVMAKVQAALEPAVFRGIPEGRA